MSDEQVSEAELASEVVEEEFEVFVPPEKVELSNGDIINFPKTTWKQEKQILSRLADVVDLPVFDEIRELEKVNAVTMVKIVTSLVRESPEKVEEIIEILLDRDKKYIEDNLTIEDITSLLVPFLKWKSDLVIDAWTRTS